MTWLTRLDRGFVRFNEALVILLMATMTVLVFTNVVARYGFGRSFGWAEELSRFAMIWVTFLGAGLALRYGQLVSVDLIQTLVSPTARRVLRWLAALLILLFLAALLWLGIHFVEFSWRNRTPVLRLPRGLPYMAVPLGAAFLIAHLLLIWRRFVTGDFEPFIELDDETTPELVARGIDPSRRSGGSRSGGSRSDGSRSDPS